MNNELYSVRLAKLDKLTEKGITPYSDKYPYSHTIKEAMALPDGDKAKMAGRVMASRSFGKLMFVVLQDRSGKGQLSFQKKILPEEAWWLIQKGIDIGDFIGVEGSMWTTKKGERTLDVENIKFLSKGLHTLPEKWHGIKDKEIIYRQRYLDILMDQESRKRFETRVRIIKLIRQFLDERDFMEVETPIMQAASSGAAARPFITHHNALQQDFYLRISPETYLKRLVVGGLEKVYELGKNFRNEGLGPSHLQEFTMLEWYVAYWDYRDNMQLIQELIQYILKEILGTTIIEYQGLKLDFGGQWDQVEYQQIVKDDTGIDILKYDNRDELATEVSNRFPEFEVDKYHSLPALIDALYKNTVRPKLIQPTFLLHHPTVLVPLARRNNQNHDILDMFQVVVNSWEIVKAYSELINPLDQRERMMEQLKYKEQGDDETMMMEEDYIECMGYGMPPSSGLGLGIDRIVALITNAESLRDVVFFPNVRVKAENMADSEIQQP